MLVAYISLADDAHYATYTNNNIKFCIASNAQYREGTTMEFVRDVLLDSCNYDGI